MKNKDLLLLSNLRANARETLTKISKNTNIPISTIFDRLKHHERTIIKKHTAIIDFSKLGFSTRVTMTLKVNKDDRKEIKEFLTRNHNVNSVYKINNGYDFLLEGIFRNIKDLEDFIESLDEKFRIRSKQVFYIVEDVKREEFFSDPQILDMVCA